MKPLYKIIEKYFNKWNQILPTAGQLAVASFFIIVISGVALIIPYNVSNPFQSIQIISLINIGGKFFRNIHYWSAQIFLVLFLWHMFEHLFFSTEKEVKKGIWMRLVLSIPIVLYLMLFGFILKGDSESIMARQIFGGLINAIPVWNKEFEFALIGKENDFQIIYAHHIATFSIILFVIIIEHTKRIWSDWVSIIYMVSVCIIFSVFFSAPIHNELNPVIKGPWYFIGLQEILHWTANPEWILVGFFLILFLIYILIKTSEKSSRRIKYFLILLFLIYTVFSIIGWIFRGENWQLVLP